MKVAKRHREHVPNTHASLRYSINHKKGLSHYIEFCYRLTISPLLNLRLSNTVYEVGTQGSKAVERPPITAGQRIPPTENSLMSVSYKMSSCPEPSTMISSSPNSPISRGCSCYYNRCHHFQSLCTSLSGTLRLGKMEAQQIKSHSL